MARILVVGPDPDLLALLRFACARVPHDVLVATAAPSALTLVQQAAPDLTLIDAARPGGQGLVLLRQVRAASTRPIIVLTPRRSDAHQIACFDAGAAIA